MAAVNQELVHAHPFCLYDTMLIGPTASTSDPNWYDDFQDMAQQDRLLFFQGRKANSLAWTNQPGERRDWAFYAQQMSLEMFTTYPAMGEFVSQPLDSTLYPALWSQLAQGLSAQITMGDAADIVWQSPLSFVPTSSAPTGTTHNAAAAPVTVLGNSGVPIKQNNVLKFPGNGLDIPAKSKIEVALTLASQMKTLLTNAALPVPGYVEIQGAGGVTVRAPFYYGLRLNLYGIRRVQLRGGRESS
jgi:hypothetical protein